MAATAANQQGASWIPSQLCLALPVLLTRSDPLPGSQTFDREKHWRPRLRQSDSLPPTACWRTCWANSTKPLHLCSHRNGGGWDVSMLLSLNLLTVITWEKDFRCHFSVCSLLPKIQKDRRSCDLFYVGHDSNWFMSFNNAPNHRVVVKFCDFLHNPIKYCVILVSCRHSNKHSQVLRWPKESIWTLTILHSTPWNPGLRMSV